MRDSRLVTRFFESGDKGFSNSFKIPFVARFDSPMSDEFETSDQIFDGQDVPKSGRLGGIDFGTVRIGLAISNKDQTIASPVKNYQRRGSEGDAKYFLDFGKEEQICGWVVGLPLHMSGDESAKSKECRHFGKWLFEITKLPVCFHDERYSSSLADDAMEAAGLSSKKRKSRRDMLSAQIILSSFLDFRRQVEIENSREN